MRRRIALDPTARRRRQRSQDQSRQRSLTLAVPATAVQVVIAALLVAALALTATAAPALADGDPASDVLLGESVFYPYTPAVTPAVQKALNAETAAATRAGFPIKVALIASPVDLGVIPNLFGQPQRYANFLDEEISFQGRVPLLVVMWDGFGVQGLDSDATAAAATLTKPAGRQSTALALAATAAVAKLAAAAGHPLKPVARIATRPAGASSGNSSSSTVIVLIVLIVAAVSTAGALVMVRRRRAPV
jgi:hypothetical protein